jgi:dynein intermediate chain
MLNLPQSTIDLKNETKNRRDLAVMTLSFPENETNTLYMGAEDGSVCQVHIHGSKVGVTEVYDGHEGPVTGVDMHPHQDATQYGVDTNFDIALSCSFDWSVKLWLVKQYQSAVLSLDAFEDYVYDAKWHPTNPAVFASVDGEGHVDLWNLNHSTESPKVCMASPHHRQLALNHCHWSLDGRNLVTGDSEGNLAIYSVDKSIAQPRNEDFQTFQEKVRSLQPIVPRSVGGAVGGGFSTTRAVNFADAGRH